MACCFSPTAAFVAAAAGVSVSVAAAAVSAGTPPTFAAHPERVNDVHWACGFVASAGDDGAVTLFDERTGALSQRIAAHSDICKTVRIADDVVLTGAEDRTARLFRLSGEEAVLRGHSAAVALVAHLPGGTTCLTASEDGSCRIWDYARAFAQDAAPGSDKAIAAVVFVEGGLIVADGGGVLRRFDDDGKREIWHTKPLEAAHAAVTALAISGGLLAVAMYKRLHLRKTADGAEASPHIAFDDWVNCCAFVGGSVALAGDAADVHVWDAGNRRVVTHNRALKTDSVLAMACRDDLLATGDNDGRVNVWSAYEGHRNAKLEGWVVSLCFCGHVLAATTAGTKGAVYVLDPATCEIRARSSTLGCSLSWVGAVGERLVTACEAKLVHAWVQSGAKLHVEALFPGAARFGSPDGVGGQGAICGDRVAVGDESGRLYVLDLE